MVLLLSPSWSKTASVHVKESGTSENLWILSKSRLCTKVKLYVAQIKLSDYALSAKKELNKTWFL